MIYGASFVLLAHAERCEVLLVDVCHKLVAAAAIEGLLRHPVIDLLTHRMRVHGVKNRHLLKHRRPNHFVALTKFSFGKGSINRGQV